MNFLGKKRALSVFKYSSFLPSYHKSENKTNEPFLRKTSSSRTDRQTLTDRQRDRETDRQTDRYTDRQRQFYMTLRRTGAPKVNCLLVMSLQRWDNWTWSIKMAHKDFFNKKCLQVKTDVFRTQESIYDGVFFVNIVNGFYSSQKAPSSMSNWVKNSPLKILNF